VLKTICFALQNDSAAVRKLYDVERHFKIKLSSTSKTGRNKIEDFKHD
jgi:hypothetical protein